MPKRNGRGCGMGSPYSWPPAWSDGSEWSRADAPLRAPLGSLSEVIPPMRRILPRLALVILVTGTVLAVTAVALAVPASIVGTSGTGQARHVAFGPLNQRSYIYGVDGSLMATLKGEENRQPVGLDQVP